MIYDFACDRTCPRAGQRWCRFRPLLDLLGPVRVDSHTVRVAVHFADAEALRSAVEAMGGVWLGAGRHRLHATEECGLGFRLPGWHYPLVALGHGVLAYDDYGGCWGRREDLDRLRAEYLWALAEGRGCHDAILTLGLGPWLEARAKPEFAAETVQVQAVEGGP